MELICWYKDAYSCIHGAFIINKKGGFTYE